MYPQKSRNNFTYLNNGKIQVMSRRRVDPQPPSDKASRSEGRGKRGRRAAKSRAVATITVDRPHGLAVLSHSDRRLLAIVVGVSITAGILHNTNGNPVLSFLASAIALGAIAPALGQTEKYYFRSSDKIVKLNISEVFSLIPTFGIEVESK